MIDAACEATIVLEDGEAVIDIKKPGKILFKTANARGSNIVFKGLKANGTYLIYAYAQDGNKKTSELSQPVYVKI